MSTRSGDLDPGLVMYLLRQKKIPAEELEQILTKQSGLKALSGGTSDVQELLAKESADPKAALALTIFCYQAKKFIGSLSAALGGLDTLVFTGGIGEHAAAIRQRICEGLQFLGIDIDKALNEAGARIISSSGKVGVRVIPTNEELMIARHTNRLWRG
jgi:acetate kinase